MSHLPQLAELTDEQYDIADAIIAAMEADPSKTWTPSRIARKVHTDASTAHIVLRHLYRSIDIDCDDRGAWTHYYLLTGARRDARIREVTGA